MIEQLLNILTECEDAKTRAALRQLISGLLTGQQEAPSSQTQKISALTYQEIREAEREQRSVLCEQHQGTQQRLEKGRMLGLRLERDIANWLTSTMGEDPLLRRIEHLHSNSGASLYMFADIAIYTLATYPSHLAFIEIKSRRRTAQYISTPSDDDAQTLRLQRQYQQKMESHPNAPYFILYADYQEPVEDMLLYPPNILLDHYSYRLYRVPTHRDHIKHAEEIVETPHLPELFCAIYDRLPNIE